MARPRGPAIDVPCTSAELRRPSSTTIRRPPAGGWPPARERAATERAERVRGSSGPASSSTRWHIHGSGFRIVATVGLPIPAPAQLTMDTIPVHQASGAMASSSSKTRVHPGLARKDLPPDRVSLLCAGALRPPPAAWTAGIADTPEAPSVGRSGTRLLDVDSAVYQPSLSLAAHAPGGVEHRRTPSSGSGVPSSEETRLSNRRASCCGPAEEATSEPTKSATSNRANDGSEAAQDGTSRANGKSGLRQAFRRLFGRLPA